MDTASMIHSLISTALSRTFKAGRDLVDDCLVKGALWDVEIELGAVGGTTLGIGYDHWKGCLEARPRV